MTQEPGGGGETGGVSPGVACETGGMGRAMSIGVVGESPAARGGVHPLPLRSGGAQRLTAVVHRRAGLLRPSPSVSTRGLRCGGRRAEGREWGGGGRAQAGWGGGSERDE